MIERSNRTVKNKTRTMTHVTPYKRIPKLMVIVLVMGAVKWINIFPNKTGISRTMRPSTIVLGLPKPNMKFKRIAFGLNAMVYTGTTNKMNASSVPEIALNFSSEHGGHYFMPLRAARNDNCTTGI